VRIVICMNPRSPFRSFSGCISWDNRDELDDGCALSRSACEDSSTKRLFANCLGSMCSWGEFKTMPVVGRIEHEETGIIYGTTKVVWALYSHLSLFKW